MADAEPGLHDAETKEERGTLGMPTGPSPSLPVGRVLAHLADQPAANDLLAAMPEPTWEDVRSIMGQSSERAGDVASGSGPEAGEQTFVTPQAFYAEMIQRSDIREILRRLAE